MSPDVDRLLADLAARADLHHPADRVAAVHRRARRAAAVRSGVAAAVVALLVAAGVTGARGFLDAREPAPAGLPAGPFLRAELREDRQLAAALPPSPVGGTRVAVSISVRGRVPRLAAPAGQPAPEGRDNLLRQEIDWGDQPRPAWQGSQRDDALECDGGALVAVSDDYVVDHAYQRPGTYTVTFRTAACPPLGEVRRSVTITVAP